MRSWCVGALHMGLEHQKCRCYESNIIFLTSDIPYYEKCTSLHDFNGNWNRLLWYNLYADIRSSINIRASFYTIILTSLAVGKRCLLSSAHPCIKIDIQSTVGGKQRRPLLQFYLRYICAYFGKRRLISCRRKVAVLRQGKKRWRRHFLNIPGVYKKTRNTFVCNKVTRNVHIFYLEYWSGICYIEVNLNIFLGIVLILNVYL